MSFQYLRTVSSSWGKSGLSGTAWVSARELTLVEFGLHLSKRELNAKRLQCLILKIITTYLLELPNQFTARLINSEHLLINYNMGKKGKRNFQDGDEHQG